MFYGTWAQGARLDGPLAWLTGVLSRQLQLQLLHLLDQQRDVLEHVFVLQQELVYSCLGLQPRRSLGSQLILQQVNLERRGGRETERRRDREERGALIRTTVASGWPGPEIPLSAFSTR